MGWQNLFSYIFTQHKFVNEEIFLTVLQKHKLNPAHVRKITKNLYKTTFKVTSFSILF